MGGGQLCYGIDDDSSVGAGVRAHILSERTVHSQHETTTPNVQPWPAPPPPSALAQLRTALAKPFKRLFRGNGARRR